jgi:hypothetical protein
MMAVCGLEGKNVTVWEQGIDGSVWTGGENAKPATENYVISSCTICSPHLTDGTTKPTNYLFNACKFNNKYHYS